MAIKTFSIANFTQTSSWTVGMNEDGSLFLISGPSIAAVNKGVTFSGIPAGSIINSATLTASFTNVNYKLRTLDGSTFSGSRNVKAKVSAGGTASFEFKWQGSGSGGPGSYTTVVQYSNIKITVDYTEPTSALSLNKSACVAGQSIRCTITPANATATHRIRISMSGVTTHVSPALAAGVKVYDFIMPLDWLDAMPNNTSRVVTFELETYNGAVNTGSVTRSASLTLPADAAPDITQMDVIRVPGFVDTAVTAYVQTFSQAQVLSAAAAKYGASISKYSVSLGAWSALGQDVTSPVIEEAGTLVITLEVTDGRGQKTSDTRQIVVVPYEPPSLQAPEVYRCDAAGLEDISGTHVGISTGISVAPLGGEPDVNVGSLKARVYEKGSLAPDWSGAGILTLVAGTALVHPGMDAAKSYTIDILAADKLSYTVYTAEISTAKAGISVLREVAGVAIGKIAETPGILDVALPIDAPYLVGQRNMLHNWDFRSPVNQRGVSGTISTPGYFIDRWLLVSGSVTINAGSIAVSAGGVIEQRIEGNRLAGLPVVVSVLVGGQVYTGHGVFPSGAPAVTFDLTAGAVTLGTASLDYAAGYMVVRISPAAAAEIEAVKTEFGTLVSSLANDPPMDVAVEFLKCQRFFYNAGLQPQFAGRVVATGTVAGCIMSLPVVMRTNPSISSELTTIYSNATEYTGSTLSSIAIRGTVLYFTPVMSAGMPLRTPVSGHFRAGADIHLSAEL